MSAKASPTPAKCTTWRVCATARPSAVPRQAPTSAMADDDPPRCEQPRLPGLRDSTAASSPTRPPSRRCRAAARRRPCAAPARGARPTRYVPSTSSAPARYSGKRSRESPKTGPTSSAMSPRMTRNPAVARRAPPTPERLARRDHAHTHGERDQHGVVEGLPLRDAEVELELEGGETDQRRGGERLGQQARPARPGGRRPRLREHQPGGDRRQRGAADHQQVGGTPHGDVDPVHGVPVVVQREADQGAGAHQAHRERRPRDAQASHPQPDAGAVGGGQHDRGERRRARSPRGRRGSSRAGA